MLPRDWFAKGLDGVGHSWRRIASRRASSRTGTSLAGGSVELGILGAKVWMEMHFALELDNLGAKNWAESHILEGQDFNCARDTDNWESEL